MPQVANPPTSGVASSVTNSNAVNNNISTINANNNNNNNNNQGTTIVGYRLPNETVPYISKIAGSQITLRQFKAHVALRKNWRYFFKHESDEFGTGHVMVEVTDENEVLPMVDGKIFATLEFGSEEASGTSGGH